MSTKFKLILAAIGFMVILGSLFVGCERIDAGHVGIKVNNTGGNQGVSKTEYVTGFQFYLKWASKIYEFPVSQQHIDYEETSIVTKGGFVTTIKPSFNYSINGGNVADMFQNLRVGVKQMEQGWLKNAIIGSVNDVANTYSVDSIFNHRQEFENDIVKECNKRVSKWFTVSQLRTNIVPPKEITDAIVAKTRAIQEEQAAITQKKVVEAQAQNEIVTAKKDSTVKMLAANAEANAIRVKQDALKESPQYVELIKAQQWDGKLPQTIIGGSGAVPFFNIQKQ